MPERVLILIGPSVERPERTLDMSVSAAVAPVKVHRAVKLLPSLDGASYESPEPDPFGLREQELKQQQECERRASDVDRPGVLAMSMLFSSCVHFYLLIVWFWCVYHMNVIPPLEMPVATAAAASYQAHLLVKMRSHRRTLCGAPNLVRARLAKSKSGSADEEEFPIRAQPKEITGKARAPEPEGEREPELEPECKPRASDTDLGMLAQSILLSSCVHFSHIRIVVYIIWGE